MGYSALCLRKCDTVSAKVPEAYKGKGRVCMC